MQLDELQLNRQLYKTQPQTLETLNANDVASNLSPAPSTAIASGNSVTDVNTNAEYINGAVIEPGTIPPSTLDIANFGWTQTCAFSVVDADTVSWGSGAFTSADGVNNLSIGAGSTGNMGAYPARTYIYLDINVSLTAYQTTTNITTPVGIGKVLIAVCAAAVAPSVTATYNPVQATQIVSDNILANTIVAEKMNVAILSAITANLGTITAGTITGVLFRTAASGQRIEITSSPTNTINFYDSSTLYGSLEVESSGGSGHINLSTPDGAGLFLNTDVGSSGFGGASLQGQGGSVDVNGNASNSYATLGTLNGGSFGIHGGPTGDEIFSDDGVGGYVPISMDMIPGTTAIYDLGTTSLKWGSLFLSSTLVLEETGAGTDTITLQAPSSIAASYTLTLPTTDGSSGEFLQTDGSGVLSWASSSGGANTALSNLASVAINTSLLPSSADAINLGSTSLRWATTWTGFIRLTNNSGTVYYNNNIALDFFASSIECTDNFNPSVDTNYTLGTSSLYWAEAFIDNLRSNTIVGRGGDPVDTISGNYIGGDGGALDLGQAGRLQVSNHLDPTGTGSLNLGGATRYWGDVSYKTLTDRGCLGWYDEGVELQDGTKVSDTEALLSILKHPTNKTPAGAERIDYTSLPKHVYVIAKDHEGNILPRDENDRPYEDVIGEDGVVTRNYAEDGAETTALISIMIGSIKEITNRLSLLEKK